MTYQNTPGGKPLKKIPKQKDKEILRIRVTKSMVKPVTPGSESAYQLFDDNIKTPYFPGWNPDLYPSVFMVDLRQPKQIGYIEIYDGTGQPVLTMWGGNTPTEVSHISDLHLDTYEEWKQVPVAKRFRYLYFKLDSAQGDRQLTDIRIYAGSPVISPPVDSPKDPPVVVDPPVIVDPPTDPPVIPKTERTGVARVIGSNTFHWVPMSVLSPMSWIRHYFMWEWIEETEGIHRFEPSDRGNANLDTYYEQLNVAGKEPLVCINTSPTWIRNAYPSQAYEVRPCKFGKDPTNPESYIEFGKMLFQFAARYGSVKHPDTNLKVNTDIRWGVANVKKSGLNLVRWIEPWNEPPKWWKGKQSDEYMTPQMYAACLSACYDGHCNTMGPLVGIKNADPSMNVAMAGLPNFELWYLRDMITWFKANRPDGKIPFDAVNWHRYSNKTGGLEQGFTESVSPEVDTLRDDLRELVAFQKDNLPGKLTFFSEFGYDTDASSIQAAKPRNGMSAEEVQALYLVRSFLEIIASGVDAAMLFNAIDEYNVKGGLFQSSGIATGEHANPPYAKKVAHTKLLELANLLDGWEFEADVSTDAVLRVYSFKKAGKTMRISWRTDETGVGEWPIVLNS